MINWNQLISFIVGIIIGIIISKLTEEYKMFKKKVPITETPEYKAQQESIANSKTDSIQIGKTTEQPKEATLQDQVIAMTDSEFRTTLLTLILEVREEVQTLKEMAENELK